jgi:hypothetical protein
MRCPSQRGPEDNSAWPNPCAPVPQSRTISVPSSPRTSTHDVLPPWRSVIGPGLAKDPRVPQNRICILVPLARLKGAALRTIGTMPVLALPQQLVSRNERTTTTPHGLPQPECHTLPYRRMESRVVHHSKFGGQCLSRVKLGLPAIFAIGPLLIRKRTFAPHRHRSKKCQDPKSASLTRSPH